MTLREFIEQPYFSSDSNVYAISSDTRLQADLYMVSDLIYECDCLGIDYSNVRII